MSFSGDTAEGILAGLKKFHSQVKSKHQADIVEEPQLDRQRD
jgi:hypothetical protein